MQFVITQKMRSQLADLGYSSSEVDALNTERAAAIIRHKIKRPARGVPDSWSSPPKGKSVPNPMRAAVRALGAVTKPIGGLLPGGVAGPVVLAGALAASVAFGGAGGGILRPSRVASAPPSEPEDEEPETDTWSPPPASTEVCGCHPEPAPPPTPPHRARPSLHRAGVLAGPPD